MPLALLQPPPWVFVIVRRRGERRRLAFFIGLEHLRAAVAASDY